VLPCGGFITLSLGCHLGVELFSVVVVPGKHGVYFANRALGMLFDDLFWGQALPIEPDNVTNRHARAIDAQTAAANAGSANERSFEGGGHDLPSDLFTPL
jgi:hypothetical protein